MAAMKASIPALAGLVIFIAAASSANAQEKLVPDVWDIRLGMHVADLPHREFVDPACGTNGGPPSRPLDSFADFALCRPEANGLREVHFVYDDELEYWAKAIGDKSLIARYTGTRVMDHPAILSILVDDAGLVQGVRMVTDPRADAMTRREAFVMRIRFKARYSIDGWDCVRLAREEGEEPIAGRYEKDVCMLEHGGDKRLRVESRFYFKAGQGDFDRFTGERTEGSFESSARLEIFSLSVPLN